MKTIIPKSNTKLKFYGIVAILLITLACGLIRFEILEGNRESVTIITNNTPNPIVIGAIKSKKYYFPWCFGARRLKNNQKMIFKNVLDAQNAGFKKGSACKGLD